jgi:L-lysine exporter family protein LysE/ArgO
MNSGIAAFIHGFLLALGLILPLGVQNVFVFNQGVLQKSIPRALPAIITAAVCDTILITLAVVGVSAIVLSCLWLKTMMLVLGSLFLIYMGGVTWTAKPGNRNEAAQVLSVKKQIVFAASVSLLNPHAIIDTIGVIGTSSLSYGGTAKFAFTCACILVSWFWFFALALAGRATGELDKTGRLLYTLNKVSAVIMWGASLHIVLSLVRR